MCTVDVSNLCSNTFGLYVMIVVKYFSSQDACEGRKCLNQKTKAINF